MNKRKHQFDRNWLKCASRVRESNYCKIIALKNVLNNHKECLSGKAILDIENHIEYLHAQQEPFVFVEWMTEYKDSIDDCGDSLTDLLNWIHGSSNIGNCLSMSDIVSTEEYDNAQDYIRNAMFCASLKYQEDYLSQY